MDLSLTDDQRAILDAIDVLLRPYGEKPIDESDFVLYSHKLDQELEAGGFLDVAFDEDLGLVSAALVVERLARSPYAAETAASSFIRPLLGELPRPICLVENDQRHAPVRFLQPGATIVNVTEDSVTSCEAIDADVDPVADTLFAYPVAMLTSEDRSARSTSHSIAPSELIARWRLAVASEVAGLLRGAIDSAVTYVSERKQFGRPIAAFQAVRHRLADAHVRAEGTRLLALKAADSGDPGEAALAAHYAQSAAKSVVYDLHQFLGAMGVTLEHPLHLWTYRLKALTSDLGGGHAQARDAAGLIWTHTDVA